MKKDLYITLIFSLSLLTVFSLGYFSANLVKLQKPPLVIEKITNDSNYTQENEIMQEGEVVASANSDKYHYLSCPGAKRIKEENKIYFKDAEEALRAGFVLAGNCK
ncbi:MAG: hypothetical protein WDZ40_01290 [Candidatus Spechtbacterales bacterium]